MKQIILTLALLFLTLLPTTAAKKIEANPINIAATLVEKTDSAKVASTLEYYGYTLRGKEDSYCVMKHTNGSEIRFTFSENGAPNKYPTVIVKHNVSQRDLHDRLKGLNFEKSGNSYEKTKNAYSRYSTYCNTGSNGTIIFRRIQR